MPSFISFFVSTPSSISRLTFLFGYWGLFLAFWYPIHFAAAVNTYEVLFNILRVEGTEDEIFRKADDGVSF